MKVFYLFFFLCLPGWILGQTLQGQVIDKATKIALIGAMVENVDRDITIQTDFEGRFEIEASIGDSIRIIHVFYEPIARRINSLEITFKMKEAMYVLSDPVLIAVPDKYKYAHSFERIEKSDIPSNVVQGQQDIYNAKPGLFMHAGALNTNRLTIRGIGSRSPFSTTKIRAYVNDIPITTGIGESNLEDINLSFIEKINIYKGPTRPVFGAGLGGAIHYSIRNHTQDNIQASNQLSVGSYGTLKNNTEFSIKHKKLYVAANYDRLLSVGYRAHNRVGRHIFSSVGFLDLKKGALKYYINHTDLSAQIPSSLSEIDFDVNPRKAAFNWQQADGNEQNNRSYGGLSYELPITNHWMTKNIIFAGRYFNDERRPFNVLNQTSAFVGFRSVNTVEYLRKRGEFLFGTEMYREGERWNTRETLDQGAGMLLSDNQEQRTYVNIFLEHLYRWKFLHLRTGLNLNATRYQLTDFLLTNGDQSGQYRYKPILSPFISLEYKTKDHYLYYLSISHGYSIPTLEETLTQEDLINEAIEPETGYNVEVGMRRKIGQWEIDAALYYMYVFNLLVPERVTEDQYIVVNAGVTGHPGVETTIRRYYKLGYQYYLKTNFSYQYGPHRFIQFNNKNQDFSGAFLPGNPNHRAHAAFILQHYRGKLAWSHQLVSKMFADDANTIEVPGYYLSNLHAEYQIWANRFWSIRIHASVNNIFNEQYASMLAVNPRSFGGNAPRYLYPGLEQNYFAGVQVGYKL